VVELEGANARVVLTGNAPSKANAVAFERAVDEVAASACAQDFVGLVAVHDRVHRDGVGLCALGLENGIRARRHSGHLAGGGVTVGPAVLRERRELATGLGDRDGTH